MRRDKEGEKWYSYCDEYGEWGECSEKYLDGIELEDLEEVVETPQGILCRYEGGKEVRYENCYGTWGFPVTFR